MMNALLYIAIVMATSEKGGREGGREGGEGRAGCYFLWASDFGKGLHSLVPVFVVLLAVELSSEPICIGI